MINCGAMIDVIETFQPEDHIIFFICDRSVKYSLNAENC